jgi:hypothetical protein
MTCPPPRETKNEIALINLSENHNEEKIVHIYFAEQYMLSFQ